MDIIHDALKSADEQLNAGAEGDSESQCVSETDQGAGTGKSGQFTIFPYVSWLPL